MKPINFKAKIELAVWQIWYNGYQPNGLIKIILGLLESTYKLMRFFSGQDSKVKASRSITNPPVLVVGNLIAGGAGKTPVVMAVCQYLSASGKRVGVVSRGYGRQSSRTILIDPRKPLPQAIEVGDEPLFLCKKTGCPVAVSGNRVAAFNTLLAAFPDLDLVVSDDGLQHHRLKRQMEWLVFNEQGQGNGRLLPAGPLREPLSRLHTVDAVLASNLDVATLGQVLNEPPRENWYSVQMRLEGFSQLETGDFMTTEEAVKEWKNTSVLAFAGIANPQKLFDTIEAAGISLQEKRGLPDHFNYPVEFCIQFNQHILITTGKDAVKLSSLNSKIWVAQMYVALPSALTQALENCIGSTID